MNEVPKPERFFYISYNGEKEVPAKDFMFSWGERIIGHMAFSHLGFPSLIYITEQLIPDYCKKSGNPVPSNIILTCFQEFKSEEDFDDFTIGRGMNDQLDTLGLN